MKKPDCILVTGGAGFIGSHLCEYLLKADHHVVCVDSFNDFYDPEIKKRNISSIIDHQRFSLVRADIRSAGELAMVFEKSQPDLVIHLAAMPGVIPSVENPMNYYDVNVMGTLTVLETMRRFKVNRLLFASSSSVYGNNSKIPFAESDPVDNQISPYASSKRACELLCYTYHSLYGFDIFCLRFFTVYGPRQRPDLAIHKFTSRILENKPIQIFGDGSTSRDYTFIADIVNGIYNSISRLEGFGIYNLGGSETISLTRMIETIEDALGKKAIREYLPPQPGDVKRTYADIAKAGKDLNYNPGVDFKRGIKEFVAWKINQASID
ncbi:MAG: NAD-dependent epimerase/dehydratase family protein [Bacteroidales bacterium]